MTTISRKKASKGRFNILLMRSKGQVTNLAVSPLLLLAAFLFTLAFIAVSVAIMHRYFALYLDYHDLSAAYEETAKELDRLQSLYTYQASVADDYSNLMQALNRADPQNDTADDAPPANDPPPASGEESTAAATPPGTADNTAAEGPATPAAGDTPPEAAPIGPPQTLEDWAKRLPAVAAEPEQVLDVENFTVSDGGRFSFSLLNNAPDGRAAQGRLLLAFTVETPDGQTRLLPYPDFDLSSGDPDFEQTNAPAYRIQASKIVNERLNLPPGGVVKSVMVAAKSRAGNIVMKKLVPLGD